MSKRNLNRYTLNEGIYDFYELYDPSPNSKTIDKIQNYYIDKVKKHGRDSLTKKEMEIFRDATNGKLKAEEPIYKRDKVTGDIEIGKNGKPIRIDLETIPPGIPFITTKGRNNGNVQTKSVVNGRCYWNVDDKIKAFYIYGGEVTAENPRGLIIWKSVSSKPVEKPLGAFIVPKGEAQLPPEELWKSLNNKYDKGIVLDKETYMKFLAFDDLYHNSKKALLPDKYTQLKALYDYLAKYPNK